MIQSFFPFISQPVHKQTSLPPENLQRACRYHPGGFLEPTALRLYSTLFVPLPKAIRRKMPTVHSSLAPGSDFRFVRASRVQGPEFRLRAQHLCVAPNGVRVHICSDTKKAEGLLQFEGRGGEPSGPERRNGGGGGGGLAAFLSAEWKHSCTLQTLLPPATSTALSLSPGPQPRQLAS